MLLYECKIYLLLKKYPNSSPIPKYTLFWSYNKSLCLTSFYKFLMFVVVDIFSISKVFIQISFDLFHPKPPLPRGDTTWYFVTDYTFFR